MNFGGFGNPSVLVPFGFTQPSVSRAYDGGRKRQDTPETTDGVLKRTSNSVIVRIEANNDYSEWEVITVGGSVKFEWKVTQLANTNSMNYFIKFSKNIPSDKVNYIVTYTHWEVVDKIPILSTAVMRVRTDHFGAVYCPCSVPYNSTKEVTVEISTDQSSPCAIIYDDDELTDFMLRGKDGSVPFHKVVLAAHSSVFKTMLAGEWKETSEGVIDVPGTSKEMLQHLKKYMYLGKLPEKQNEQVDCLKQLLLLSSCYLIEDLKLRCIKELRFSLAVENVSDMVQFAMENKVKLLHIEIMDSAAMGEINMNEVRKLVEAEEATLLQCK